MSAARIIGDDGRELIGYVDRWSARVGETLRLMISATAPEVGVRLVRVHHGDPNPAGPGLRVEPIPSPIDGTYPGVVQTIRAGSHALIESDGQSRTLGVWVWMSVPAAGREQVLVERGALRLFVAADGSLGLRCEGAEIRSASILRREAWTRIVGVAGTSKLTLAVGNEIVSILASSEPAAGAIHAAVSAAGDAHLDGRLEEPFSFARALEERELTPSVLDVIIPDDRWDLRDATLVQAPTTAVTGRLWDDDTTDFRARPDEYAAVHFHSDDVEDAGWEPALAFTIPEGLRSGVYAFEMTAGDLLDHIPFVVRASEDTDASVGLLLPTLTYQVYGNERLAGGGADSMAQKPADEARLDPADAWLRAHPEAGASCYDHHPDGSGVSLVSMLRPIPNMRPSFVWWVTESPERFGADLYVVDWLEHLGERFDVFTDHDLHREGEELLRRYRVILTGTHPEYSTRPMLVALEAYLAGGGRILYLGGNGFYWVTTIDPDRPHLSEVRRGVNGTRAWTSRPGESRHQTTGEHGGLWRYRGRSPNRLVGVGFASQSDSSDRAPGFRRTVTSHHAQYSWIFAGVDAELFGEHGLYLGGAAGYEIDSCDCGLGSPDRTVVLATSAGRHPDSYLVAVEDMQVTVAGHAGSTSSRVRADVVYLPYPNGGAVFSVGSCSWAGSLSTNGYDNDVARITGNVLRGFLATPR